MFPYTINILLFIYKIILPFLISLVLSFVLYPLIKKIEKGPIKRFFSISIVFVLIAGLLVLIITMLIPVVIDEVELLKRNLPEILENIQAFLAKYNIKLNYDKIDQSRIIQETINKAYGFFYMIFFIPVLVFYFLLDYEKIRKKLLVLNNGKYKNFILDVVKNLRAYFKGLIIVTFILTVVCTFFFIIIGLDFPLLFGFLIAFTNIIPYIGPYIGGVLTCLYALNTSKVLALIVLIFVFILQMLESNILTPYIQSKFMKIHPLLVILSFLFFSKLFGFVGMLISLPLLSIIILIVKHTLLPKSIENG